MRKVYYYPTHILDLMLVVYRLDGTVLTLERIKFNTVQDPSPGFSESLAGFEEVDKEEFLLLIAEQASEESVKAFTERYNEIYK